jgi:cyclase
MLKKRLIGVITVKNGWAVQSMGYRRYLPLGKPECLMSNLDRWGADEILIQVIDRADAGHTPDYALLQRLAQLGLGTPLIYSGGIRTVNDGVRVIQSGADRLVLDAGLHDDLKMVEQLAETLGAQAIIAGLPLSIRDCQLLWLDHRSASSEPIRDDILSLLNSGSISEILIIDWQHEGYVKGFDFSLIELFPDCRAPFIAFGGISELEQMTYLFNQPNVSAVAVGNSLNYREHAIQFIKTGMVGLPLREANYHSKHNSFLYG